MTRIKNRHNNGSALVAAAIVTVVFILLSAAIYALFQANISAHEWERDELIAMYTAEAGAAIASYMILDGAQVPGGISPVMFLPDSSTSGWYNLDYDNLGVVKVAIDPHNNNAYVTEANAYGVRVLGKDRENNTNYMFGMEMMMMPLNFARFACFLDNPNTNGYYGDGYRFDGPFHANGPICIYSSSSGSTNDPYFYSLNLTCGYYYYGTAPGTQATTPEYGYLQIQPYEKMLMGEPYFDLNADTIDFGPDNIIWQTIPNKASSGGLELSSLDCPTGTRLLIKNDSLFTRKPNGFENVYVMSAYTNPVVWIDNGNSDDIYIKEYPGAGGVGMPLTIGCNGDIFIAGPHLYRNQDVLDENNTDLLGLFSAYGDIVIADDPGGSDWPSPWQIMTNGDITFDAIIMALSGELYAQYPYSPSPAKNLNIMGGYILDTEGITSISYSGGGTAGFVSTIYYDTRLMAIQPPYFPQTGDWEIIYWEENRDLTESMLLLDKY